MPQKPNFKLGPRTADGQVKEQPKYSGGKPINRGGQTTVSSAPKKAAQRGK
ncbi:MAG: hypothetical protein FWD89_01480 [Firmicutes bacterium]|nr:hypothetical protein [Bacillota bacterium]MCL2770963.1 hypothetical protein [Bacillota bacterium]